MAMYSVMIQVWMQVLSVLIKHDKKKSGDIIQMQKQDSGKACDEQTTLRQERAIWEKQKLDQNQIHNQ